ncbi:MAG: TetR/AcrR family transcriptional regulator [Candidatus Sulfotelmatobacter sp.]
MSKGHISSSVSVEALSSGNPPPVKSMGRRQRHGTETRVRLFRCALKLFAERGYPNVTVEDITEAADVGKGTFFNYFESKDQVLSVMSEIQLGKVKEALTLARAGEQTIRSVLHHLFLRSAEEPGRSPELARALLSSFLASDGVRLMAYNLACEGRKMLAQVVAEGQKRREIDPRLKEQQVALQIQQAFMGTLLLWSLEGHPALKAWAEESFEHFWGAVAASGREQKR